MIYYRFLFLLLYLPITIYFYFFLKRITIFLFKKYSKSILVRILLIILVSIIAILCSNPFGVWIVVFSHLFICSVFCDLVMLILKKYNKLYSKLSMLYNIGIIPITIVIFILIFAYWNMNNVIVNTYDIFTLKEIEDEYKIVFLSDIHFETTINEKKLTKYVNEISTLNADIVILGGDIVDENTSKEGIANAFKILGNINSKYGVFFIYGNHDKTKYYSNKKYTDDEIQTIIENSGIVILADETYEVNNELILIGRDDLVFPKQKERKKSSELLENLDKNKFLLIVDHHPYDLKINSQLGYDLQLSGHTHGGQIFPTGYFTTLFNNNSLNYGYKKINNFQVIVSSGIGGWEYPFRTGSNSEYLIVNIKKN